MSLNSVNTNIGAYVALQSLNQTNTALQATQKQISTGYRVADATDDGAAYAIAERVRSDVGALTEANAQLGNSTGLLNVTLTALKGLNDTVSSIRAKLVDISSSPAGSSQRTQDQAAIATLVTQAKAYFAGANYNGTTLIGTSSSAAKSVTDEIGTTYSIATFATTANATTAGAAGVSASLAALETATATTAATALGATGNIANQLTFITTAQNNYGAASNYLGNQTTYNSNKIDALNSGLGSLVDADLSKESAQLQSLQIRQQLGTQALSIANQAPQTLLSLFK